LHTKIDHTLLLLSFTIRILGRKFWCPWCPNGARPLQNEL